jgi:hypothetical protein
VTEKEKPIQLPDTITGTPALGDENLMLPLGNGFLYRQPLDGTTGKQSVTWRIRGADEDARGHVVQLGPELYLYTDGLRRLHAIRWPKGDMGYRTAMRPFQMPARIVAAPVLLPTEKGKTEQQLCVADSEGMSLLRVVELMNGDIELKEIRRWTLGGKITAGPFPRGDRLGCIVERRKLVWIDPANPDPVWEYQTQGEGIIGQPQLVGDSLVVADQSGRFVALDPATGKIRGPGYTLQSSAAPAATPVEFGQDRAFVPLTDGTVFLLSLSLLRDAPGGPVALQK